MKVTFLIFSLRGGGAERMVSRLSNNFVSAGIDTEIILLFDAKKIAYDIDSRIKIRDFSFHNVKNKQIKKFKQVKRIRRYIKEEKPDVLICYIITTLPFGILANIGNKNCKVITSQRTNPKSIKFHYRMIVQPFLYLCDGIIFQTNGAKKCYSRRIQKRSVVIGNIAPEFCCENSGFTNPNMICSVGRLHEDKDFKTLIDAFSIVHKKNKETSLHIYGEGPQKEELEALVTKYGLSECVVFEGFSSNISSELMKYEIFAFSSKAEGMPNSLIEAMACGLACVATDCDFGPADIIVDGENGYLVPVASSAKMADKLLFLLNNDEQRHKIQSNAKKISLKYSEEIIAHQYIDFIDSI